MKKTINIYAYLVTTLVVAFTISISSSQTAFADIISPNTHYVERCVKVVN